MCPLTVNTIGRGVGIERVHSLDVVSKNVDAYTSQFSYICCRNAPLTVVVPKSFIKHMCFIVLYFHGHAFFSLEIAKKCFFVLYFLKNVLYFCKLFKWVEYLFQVFIYNTKIGKL